jgi:signal peptidase II
MDQGFATGSTGAVCIGLALAADQIPKAVANAYSDALAGGIPVVPGFNLIFLRNDGVTFGLLGGAPWWALSGLALVVTVWLTVLLVRATSRLDAAAYGLVIGGALGNVADRLRFGAVTDFLDVYVGTWHWPAFNMADVAVVGGVGLLLLSEYRQARQARRRKARAGR